VSYVDFLGRVGDAAASLADVPRDWDYIVDDVRSRDPAQLEFTGVRLFYQAAHRHFRARIHHGEAGSEPPAYRPHGRLRLELPTAGRAKAADKLRSAGVRIALMPAGSSEPSRYPSPRSWALVVGALAAAFGDVIFCLVGKLERDGRTSTSMAAPDFDLLRTAAPRVVSAVDDSLLDQLACVEACDVFLSPHTGFGLAALAAGTPWLTLSGGPWHEWFFNGVPFYSVIPDTGRYACFTGLDDPPPLVDDEGAERTPSMTRARVEEDLPELVHAARLLVEGGLEYEHALRRHFSRLLGAYGGDRSRIFSFDGIHWSYI
jgi:hypothetical protein